MNLNELDLTNGAAILDDVLGLPRKAQELFFSIFSSALFDESHEAMALFDSLYSCGSISYDECKSPIEKIFAFAYDIIICNHGFPVSELLILHQQERIKANNHYYIADFVFDTGKLKHVYYKNPLKLVIECDGHDFHEKTPEQVTRNNQRDYDLKMADYDVIHFSGSQIYQNPLKCAQDTYDYIMSKVEIIDIDFNGR